MGCSTVRRLIWRNEVLWTHIATFVKGWSCSALTSLFSVKSWLSNIISVYFIRLQLVSEAHGGMTLAETASLDNSDVTPSSMWFAFWRFQNLIHRLTTELSPYLSKHAFCKIFQCLVQDHIPGWQIEKQMLITERAHNILHVWIFLPRFTFNFSSFFLFQLWFSVTYVGNLSVKCLSITHSDYFRKFQISWNSFFYLFCDISNFQTLAQLEDFFDATILPNIFIFQFFFIFQTWNSKVHIFWQLNPSNQW